MEKIIVSACLLGEKVRYDGKTKLLDHPLMKRWQEEGRIVGICPEIAGGLAIPRPAAEQQNDRVVTIQGQDVTDAFTKGAKQALQLVNDHNIKFALLKANSPSCGNQQIYDGSFSNTLIDGSGVTAKLLSKNGVKVYNEHQLDELSKMLEQ